MQFSLNEYLIYYYALKKFSFRSLRILNAHFGMKSFKFGIQYMPAKF